jgi:hypothetical protein
MSGTEGFPRFVERGLIPETDLEFIIMDKLGYNLK